MKHYIIRVTSWYQGLNPQRKLGLRLMFLAVLLMAVGILGLMGIIPNPLENAAHGG